MWSLTLLQYISDSVRDHLRLCQRLSPTQSETISKEIGIGNPPDRESGDSLNVLSTI